MDKPTLARHTLAEMPKNPRSPPNTVSTIPRAIDVLAFPMVQLLDVSGPLQVFALSLIHI